MVTRTSDKMIEKQAFEQIFRRYYDDIQLWQGNYHARRRFVATIRYKFNTTRSKYKGTGAGSAEKSRL